MMARPLATLGLIFVLGACPRPTDGDPQIAISPNAAARIARTPGHRATTETAARAKVHPLRAGETLSEPGGGDAESAGNLIDAPVELTKASGGDVGSVAISLVDGAGAPVRVPIGAKVMISSPASVEVITVIATQEGATMGVELPPGRWLLSYTPSVGWRGVPTPSSGVTVDVQKGAMASATLAVTDAGPVMP